MIVRATNRDLIPILQIEKECFSESNYSRVVEAWYRWTWWVAKDDNTGKMIGFCAATIVDSNVCFLSLSGVTGPARGKGLQMKMIRVRERWARKQRCKKSITYTSLSNPASSNNLIKCGYKIYHPDSYWGLVDGIYWTKDL